MQAKEIIYKKRSGEPLSAAELDFLLQSYLRGETKDYQMAAWLMAVYFQGMTPEETVEWTRLMWKSGDSLPRPLKPRTDCWIDKHSTGGIGDKTSLILVPWVSAVCERLLGRGQVKIPMMSGRGLGHTGGTLDKLEAVPGFQPRIDLNQACSLLEKNAYVMMGQTDALVPADRLIYALRDVTSTVESLPLIVSSILSKKLAESLDGLVLDVKCGSGAFMKTREEARALANALVAVAGRQGVEAVALVTRMDEPLGRTIGHALEMEESAEFLRTGTGEAGLYQVTLELASWMVCLGSRRKISLKAAREACQTELQSPRPFEIFRQMLAAQGGDWERFEKERRQERAALPCFTLRAPASGYLRALEPRALGGLLLALGGGRATKESSIDFGVGIEVEKKVGDAVAAGETLLRVWYRDPRSLPAIQTTLAGAVAVRPEAVARAPWVLECLE